MRDGARGGISVKSELTIRTAGAAALWLAIGMAMTGAALAGGDWNDAGIKWMAYDDGLKASASDGRPVCLVFYTEWCPHCATYSHVFADPKVVEQSKKFVMIRLDRDKNREISKRYAPDGEYIPRTFFLSSDGKLDPAIHAPREKFLYFYDESSPESLLGGMQEALARLKPGAAAPMTSPPAAAGAEKAGRARAEAMKPDPAKPAPPPTNPPQPMP